MRHSSNPRTAPGGLLSREPGPARPSPRAWSVAVLTICGVSGVVNLLLDRRHQAAPAVAAACPFPVQSLPVRLGGWTAREKAIEIDAKTLLISGCTSYLARRYTDENTGVGLTVLVGYGPADRVVGHTPEVCFPAFGYEPEGQPFEQAVEARRGQPPARFRSSVYARTGGLRRDRIEVAYGFRQGGRWSPDGSGGRRRSRNDPGVFKVQIERQVAEGERCEPGGPAGEFLGALIPEIEAAIADAAPGPRG